MPKSNGTGTIVVVRIAGIVVEITIEYTRISTVVPVTADMR